MILESSVSHLENFLRLSHFAQTTQYSWIQSRFEENLLIAFMKNMLILDKQKWQLKAILGGFHMADEI